jgi:RNA polymerase sigma factor (sigma-70 family)
MIPAATREAQATACLEAADQHRTALLGLARKLTGCPEEGMNLYQQTLLNCHDAIQRNGFAGEHYYFYLAQTLRNLYTRQQKQYGRERRVDFQQAEAGGDERDDEGSAPWAAVRGAVQDSWEHLHAAGAAPDAHAQLAEQVMEEVRQQFSFADRIALRLSLGGMSCQQIAEHIGTKDQSWVNRRLGRMRAQLRHTFQQAWDALGETDY